MQCPGERIMSAMTGWLLFSFWKWMKGREYGNHGNQTTATFVSLTRAHTVLTTCVHFDATSICVRAWRWTCVRTYARHYGSAFHGCGFAFHHCVMDLVYKFIIVYRKSTVCTYLHNWFSPCVIAFLDCVCQTSRQLCFSLVQYNSPVLSSHLGSLSNQGCKSVRTYVPILAD